MALASGGPAASPPPGRPPHRAYRLVLPGSGGLGPGEERLVPHGPGGLARRAAPWPTVATPHEGQGGGRGGWNARTIRLVGARSTIGSRASNVSEAKEPPPGMSNRGCAPGYRGSGVSRDRRGARPTPGGVGSSTGARSSSHPPERGSRRAFPWSQGTTVSTGSGLAWEPHPPPASGEGVVFPLAHLQHPLPHPVSWRMTRYGPEVSHPAPGAPGPAACSGPTRRARWRGGPGACRHQEGEGGAGPPRRPRRGSLPGDGPPREGRSTRRPPRWPLRWLSTAGRTPLRCVDPERHRPPTGRRTGRQGGERRGPRRPGRGEARPPPARRGWPGRGRHRLLGLRRGQGPLGKPRGAEAGAAGAPGGRSRRRRCSCGRGGPGGGRRHHVLPCGPGNRSRPRPHPPPASPRSPSPRGPGAVPAPFHPTPRAAASWRPRGATPPRRGAMGSTSGGGAPSCPPTDGLHPRTSPLPLPPPRPGSPPALPRPGLQGGEVRMSRPHPWDRARREDPGAVARWISRARGHPSPHSSSVSTL